MSSIRLAASPFAAGVLFLLGACASDGNAPLNVASQSEQVDPARVPASEVDRQMAERLPPLERANFWAREYNKNPTDLETALRFGESLRGIGSEERLVEVMTQTEVIHPFSGEVKLMKGRGLSALGRFGEARRSLTQAASLLPADPDALAALGLVNDRLGDHESAQTAYRQALDIDPDRTATRSNYGLSLVLTGDLEGAEAQLRRATELDARNTMARQNLALVLGLQGRYDEMIEAAGDAPESVMLDNVEQLRRLRGDVVVGTGHPETGTPG